MGSFDGYLSRTANTKPAGQGNFSGYLQRAAAGQKPAPYQPPVAAAPVPQPTFFQNVLSGISNASQATGAAVSKVPLVGSYLAYLGSGYGQAAKSAANATKNFVQESAKNPGSIKDFLRTAGLSVVNNTFQPGVAGGDLAPGASPFDKNAPTVPVSSTGVDRDAFLNQVATNGKDNLATKAGQFAGGLAGLTPATAAIQGANKLGANVLETPGLTTQQKIGRTAGILTETGLNAFLGSKLGASFLKPGEGNILKNMLVSGAKNLPIGYGMDVAANLQEDKTGKEALKPGLNTILAPLLSMGAEGAGAATNKLVKNFMDRGLSKGSAEKISKEIVDTAQSDIESKINDYLDQRSVKFRGKQKVNDYQTPINHYQEGAAKEPKINDYTGDKYTGGVKVNNYQEPKINNYQDQVVPVDRTLRNEKGQYNGSKPKESDLLQEARKYKTADEFLKTQGTPIYHGTNSDFKVFDRKKIGSSTDEGLFGRGFYFGNTESFARIAPSGSGANNIMEVYPSSDIKLFDISKVKSKKEMADLLDMSEDALVQDSNGIIRPVRGQSAQFSSHLQDLGYDGAVAKRGGDAVETVIFNESKIKTKSQLTDIYNQAHGGEKFRISPEDFKAATGKDITPEQIKQLQDTNKRLFGDENLNITEQILANKDALGSYKDGMINILKGQADATDTFYHEAVHKYFDAFSTREEQVAILKAGVKKYGIDDLHTVEENIAEDFIKYTQSKQTAPTTFKGYFDSIINRIKSYLKSPDAIDKLYNDIYQGKAAEMSPKVAPRPVAKEPSSTTQEQPKIQPAAKEVTVPRSQLPVGGSGETKVSRLAARVSDKLDNLTPEARAILPEYEAMTHKDQLQKAAAFVEKNPKDALAVLRGDKPAPEGLLHGSIFLAAEQKAIDSGDATLIRDLASLRATRAGQELSILAARDPNSPVKYLDEVKQARYEIRGGEEKVKKQIKQTVKEGMDVIKKSAPKAKDWASFLDEIRCA